MVGRAWGLLVLALSLAGLASLCLAAADSALAAHGTANAGPAVVTVTAGRPSEYAFTLSPKFVNHGTVIFNVTNKGKVAHGFSIDGISSKIVKPRKATMMTVVFKRAGKYVYQCVTNTPPPDFGPGYNDVPAQCGGGVLIVR